jgi:hypothetical protein
MKMESEVKVGNLIKGSKRHIPTKGELTSLLARQPHHYTKLKSWTRVLHQLGPCPTIQAFM